MRKDAKIALAVILALMVLVVIIWGRSPKPDDQLTLVPPPAPETTVVAKVTPLSTRPAPAAPPKRPSPPPQEVDAARRQAPTRPPTDHSPLFPPDPAMINHVQPDNQATAHHDSTPAPADSVAMRRDDIAEPAPGTPLGPKPPAPAPAKAVTPPADPKPAPLLVHVVEKDDNYIRLAQKYYKDPSKWRLIQKANNTEPKDLRVGQKLTIPSLAPAPAKAGPGAPAPAAPARAPTPKPSAPTYTVKKGDSFYSIARSVYRDPTKWQKLYEHNRSKLPDPKKPDSLRAGMIIEVPTLASSR